MKVTLYKTTKQKQCQYQYCNSISEIDFHIVQCMLLFKNEVQRLHHLLRIIQILTECTWNLQGHLFHRVNNKWLSSSRLAGPQWRSAVSFNSEQTRVLRMRTMATLQCRGKLFSKREQTDFVPTYRYNARLYIIQISQNKKVGWCVHNHRMIRLWLGYCVSSKQFYQVVSLSIDFM